MYNDHVGDTLGLAMSRSIGDCVVHQSGVSAEPELVVYKLNNGVVDGHGNVLTDEFVVLATDGIWDVLDNNTVVQLVVQNFINPSNGRGNWNCSDAAAFLCKTARAKWEKLSPMIDDITCIVVKLSQ
jgi:serine/threonine protein phosphatase PrpC